MPDTKVATVRREITVEAPIEVAFRVFTEEIGSWWPNKTHTLLDGRSTGVVFESRLGGRVYETAPGEEKLWGTVTDWDPPNRLAFTWKPTSEVGEADESEDTIVTVTFERAGAGARVVLVHTGWEKLPIERARQLVASYNSGWVYVLDQYVDRVKAG